MYHVFLSHSSADKPAAAFKLAQEQLSPERLASATAEETFAVSKKLLAFTNLVFPYTSRVFNPEFLASKHLTVKPLPR